MKAYVITIEDMPASVAAADRCIKSVKDFPVEKWKATTPKDDIRRLFDQKQINPRYFNEQGNSYQLNCMSAFMSHFRIWEWCAIHEEEVTIFEHDAVAVGPIPNVPYRGCITFGKPSYGSFIQPKVLGVNPLTHKRYFGGAHAYRVKPEAARVMIDYAVKNEMAGPTDIFLTLDFFPWLEEYYPWPVEARDSFTTIQRKGGCVAKHNWNEATYGIYQVQ